MDNWGQKCSSRKKELKNKVWNLLKKKKEDMKKISAPKYWNWKKTKKFMKKTFKKVFLKSKNESMFLHVKK